METRKEQQRKAREVLIKYGALIRFDKMKMYHGRVEEGGSKEEWSVDPNFNNAGNSTGNRNINKIPALSVGSQSVANEFAQARLRELRFVQGPKEMTTKVYRMVSSDNEAVVLNYKFKFEDLHDSAKAEIREAMKIINGAGYTEDSPIEFEERELFDLVKDQAIMVSRREGGALFTDEQVDEVYNSLKLQHRGLKKTMVRNILSAINTKAILNKPESYILAIQEYLESKNRSSLNVVGRPINENVVSAWLAKNHIVGCSLEVTSATLGKDIEMCSLFDLEKINTQKAVGEKYQALMDSFGGLSKLFNDYKYKKEFCKFLKDGSAREIMSLVRSFKETKYLFEADARVWEGFTVGEHTETCLRVFEDSHQESTSDDIIPFVKLAIISHDIGKGALHNNSESQKESNARYAKLFYKIIELPEDLQQILLYVIGDAQAFTTDYYVKKDTSAMNALRKDIMEKLNGNLKRKLKPKEIDGLIEVCKILQSCDSGAYTRYGVTRKEGTGLYYYNGNDRFTDNFDKPQGLRKRSFKMKSPEENQ